MLIWVEWSECTPCGRYDQLCNTTINYLSYSNNIQSAFQKGCTIKMLCGARADTAADLGAGDRGPWPPPLQEKTPVLGPLKTTCKVMRARVCVKKPQFSSFFPPQILDPPLLTNNMSHRTGNQSTKEFLFWRSVYVSTLWEVNHWLGIYIHAHQVAMFQHFMCCICIVKYYGRGVMLSIILVKAK